MQGIKLLDDSARWGGGYLRCGSHGPRLVLFSQAQSCHLDAAYADGPTDVSRRFACAGRAEGRSRLQATAKARCVRLLCGIAGQPATCRRLNCAIRFPRFRDPMHRIRGGYGANLIRLTFGLACSEGA